MKTVISDVIIVWPCVGCLIDSWLGFRVALLCRTAEAGSAYSS